MVDFQYYTNFKVYNIVIQFLEGLYFIYSYHEILDIFPVLYISGFFLANEMTKQLIQSCHRE